MDPEIPESENLTVLISCMDWGMGHVTRCVPIIKELINQKFKVVIAATPIQITVLYKELKNVEYVNIKGYKIHYTKQKFWFGWAILLQIPKIIQVIFHEKKLVRRICKQRKIDVIFSDNRPGFRNKNVYSIYLTHQLNIQTGNRITSWLADKLHHYYISKYDECWVPDTEQEGLSGKLSHGKQTLFQVTYIGPLSRFNRLTRRKDTAIAIILSGPEPQRTILEDIILQQISASKEQIVLVRGIPENSSTIDFLPSNIQVWNHLESSELNDLINKSSLIVSRSGYSSIMDLAKTGSEAILIPTPGQGEQEYLGRYLSEKKYFKSIAQYNFSLFKSVDELKENKFNRPDFDFDMHKTFIAALKEKIMKKRSRS